MTHIVLKPDTYAPTTAEVMVQYTRGWVTKRATISKADEDAATAEFDRWLARHDAEVAAKALRDVADLFDEPRTLYYAYGEVQVMVNPAMFEMVRLQDWLRAEAARLSPGGEG